MPGIQLEQADLIRTFAIQAPPRLMLFLGAGASASAGILTAADMIWQFKREIYCSETGASKEAFKDLHVESQRKRLQAYFDQKGTYPLLWDDREYSVYFERCYPHPQERRAFIRRALQDGTPSLGHECLGALLAHGKIEWIWTTNFDDLVERAERPNTHQRLAVFGPESHTRASMIMQENVRPVLCKLHGDYRYDRLQNTDEELKEIEAEIQAYFTQIATQLGLLVVGYSGRDESVMRLLEDVVNTGGLQGGLYWCVREGSKPNPRVLHLIKQAVDQTGRGGYTEVANFDDLLYRLYRQSGIQDLSIDSKAQTLYDRRRPFITAIDNKPLRPIKLNAIRVVEHPSTAYRFPVALSGWQELRQTIGSHKIVAGLLKGHAIAFGNRERIAHVFGKKITGPIEVMNILSDDLIRQDGVVMGLFYEIIKANLTDSLGLAALGKQTFFISVTPQLQNNIVTFFRGKDTVQVAKAQKQGQLYLNEGFSYQLEYHDGILWFVLEPTVVATVNGQALASNELRKVVTNAALAKRYNSVVDERLFFWLHILSEQGKHITFRYPVTDELGVRIVLDSYFAFSSLKGAVT